MTNGRIIGVPNPATVGSAPGIWDINDVQQARLTNSWPRADAIAEGGSEATVTIGPTTYRVHTFTGAGVFDLYRDYQVEFLVVAGGGGGGGGYGGGGGAGGLLTNLALPGYPQYAGSTLNVPAGSYPIVVGSGGAAATNGTESTINFPAPIQATGGGGGGSSANGSPGGSGGGGGVSPPVFPGTSGGTGIAGQGFPGGSGAPNIPSRVGGGGGAGAAGRPGPLAPPFIGAGVPINMTGSPVVYSQGGGGLNDPASLPGGVGWGGVCRFPSGLGPNVGSAGTVIIRYVI